MVLLLSKLNTKQHIEVELHLGEVDLIAAESWLAMGKLRRRCWNIQV